MVSTRCEQDGTKRGPLFAGRGAPEVKGVFSLQTDNPGYWRYIREAVPMFFEFQERAAPWPDAPKGRTRREIEAEKNALRMLRGDFDKLESISEETHRAIEALRLSRA